MSSQASLMSKLSNARRAVTWVIAEILRIFTAPLGVLGGFLDAVRGWKFSRQSFKFWFYLPAFLLLLGVYITFAFSLFERVDGKVQRYTVVSERSEPTKNLERASYQNFRFMGPEAKPAPETEDTAFGIKKFQIQYANLLGRRILSIQPNNAHARYRLALLQSISGNLLTAKEGMEELASGAYGTFPPANAWVASWLVQSKEDGGEIDPQLLGKHLGTASEWKDVPVQLLQLYAQLLEQNGHGSSALTIAKEAAERMPEMYLELARMYQRRNNTDGLREASFRVEDFFSPRLNTSQERDFDRLALAEIRFLTGRNAEAIQVLQEGIAASGGTRPQLSRGLSSLKASMFEKSIKEDPNGNFTADLSLLESAAESDPDDPKISEQITKLLRRGITPSKKIIGILRRQIEGGVTTAEAHSLLAEGYFVRGNEKEAIKNWEIALTKNPMDLSACNNLALCLAKSSKSNIPRALELVDRAASQSKDNAEILDTYGEILILAEQPKEAINRLEQAIKIDRNRLGTRKKLVTAYEMAGLKEMAAAQAEIVDAFEDGSSN